MYEDGIVITTTRT